MLQHDGTEVNKCTCFMFIKPTLNGKLLVHLWEKEIIETEAVLNQVRRPPTYRIYCDVKHDAQAVRLRFGLTNKRSVCLHGTGSLQRLIRWMKSFLDFGGVFAGVFENIVFPVEGDPSGYTQKLCFYVEIESGRGERRSRKTFRVKRGKEDKDWGKNNTFKFDNSK